MNRITQFIPIILISLFLSGCDSEKPSPSQERKNVAIGVVGPMSGPNKVIGETGLRGVKTALHPSLQGEGDSLISLIVEDDQNLPERSVKAFEKLVLVDKVTAVLLLSSSSSALAINKVADRYQVPVFVTAASYKEIGVGKEFVNQLSVDDNVQGKLAALFVRDELLIDRVAIGHNPESLHSSSLAREFRDKFVSTGGKVIATVPLRGDGVAMEKTLLELREKGTQFIYLPLAPEKIVAVYKVLKKMRWKPQVMTGDNTIPILKNSLGKGLGLVDGLLAIDLFSDDIPRSSYARMIGKVYRSLYGAAPTSYTVTAFEGTALLQAAMVRCHDPSDRHCVNSMIRQTENFEGLVGNITILPDGKARRPLIINRVSKGKVRYVVKVY